MLGLLVIAGCLYLQSSCDVGPLGCTGHNDCSRRFTTETPGSLERRRTNVKPRVLSGPREPSGAVMLPSLGGILVVDDEPKASPSWGIHFLRVQGEKLVSLPVRLPPGQSRDWDDLESATASADHVYLLGSHAHRDAERSQLCRFPIDATRATPTHLVIDAPIRCWGGHGQRRRIEQVLEHAASEHGFRLPAGFRYRRPKKGGLNLEGIHYDRAQKRFWLGLRSPLAEVGGKRYAVLLSARLSEFGIVLAFAGLIDLKGRGIRALGPGPERSLLISAGPVGKGGRFDLYLLKAKPSPPFRLALPQRVTPHALERGLRWFKPEAFVLFGEQLYIFSDSGDWPDAPAHYLRLDWRTR